MPYKITFDDAASYAYVWFSGPLTPMVLSAASWGCIRLNKVWTVDAARAFDTYVRVHKASSLDFSGADQVSYANLVGDLKSVGGVPLAAFTQY